MKLYPFSEIITDVTSKFRKIKASEYKAEGRFKIIDQGQKEIAGYTDDESLINKTHSPFIVFGDHTRTLKYEESQIALGADGAKALAVNTKLANALYIYYYLRSIYLKEAGYSRHFKFLKQVKIPIPEENGKPNLDDQKRIAHLLGKVERMIARSKQHLQQLDDLLKSVFLEMFGFRDQTYTQWPIEKLATHTAIVSGATKGKKYKTEELVEVPYMRVANVQDGHFVLDEIKNIAVTQKEIDQYLLKSGDLLLTEGGDPDKLGRGSVWENQIENCIHQNHIFRVRINERSELNPYYLSALVSSRYGKSYFLKSAKQTTGIASINSTQLKNFPVVIPPIDLQNQFASIVEKVEGLKSRYLRSLADLERLYGALSQKAFKGELDLSRVPLPVETISGDMDSTVIHRNTKPLERGFARQLLAAEILHRYNHHDMTQMKLQKLIHLAEYHARLDEVQGEYQRQAAGPFDNRMMYGIAAGLKKQQWFEMHGDGQRATYSPLSKVGSHEKYVLRWQGNMPKIDEVLQLLGKARPDQCEIVSTLYAAWNDLLIDGTEITDETIIEQASKADLWHKTKEAINPGRWPKALQWMRDHNLVPTGYGKHTRKLK